MADDLKLTVDSTELVRATQEVGKFRGSLAQMSQTASRTAGPVSRLALENGRLVQQSSRVSQTVDRSTEALRRNTAAAQRNTRSMGRGQVAIQQTGYQLGDFIVQVQSGTNAYVAAGQQLTQMAGLLTLMGGSMVAIGASLSVIIPLVTAFGAAWSRTRQEAENAGDTILSELSSLEGSYKDVADTQDRLTDAIRLMGHVQSQTSRDVIANLQQELRAREELLAVERARLEIQRMQLQAGIEERQRQIESLFADVNSTEDMFPGAGVDPGLAARRDLTLEIVEANRELFLLQREANAQLDLVNAVLESIDGGYEEIIESAETLAQANQEAFDAMTEGAQEAQQAALDVASEMYEGFERAKASTQDLMTQLMTDLGYTFEEAVRTGEALDRIGSLDTSSTVAAIMAITNELNIATAAAIALAQNMPGYTSGGVSGPDAAIASLDTGVGDSFANTMPVAPGFVRDDASGNLVSSGPSSSGSSGGGGGGGGSGGFVSMFPQIAAEVQMATQAMQAAQQEQDMLNTALEQGIITQQQYKQMMGEVEAAYGTLNEAVDEHIVTIGDFASSMAQTMSNAFMSIIDGTKSVGDAIKEMIKQIIAEFIKLAVINPIINSIFRSVPGFSFLPSFGGLFGSAKGNAFRGGGIIPFADGGVVGSPTLFPMSGSKTGLMGEAGPEAILPLSRGKGGKLGVQAEGLGQKNMVFQMTYNFQGGITEADLARATPKIVEQTKRSVVESVQRGGQFARVFK